MMETRKVFRITAFLLRSISKEVLNALTEAGVHDLYMAASRSLVIKAKKGISLLLPGRDLISDPLDLVFFLGAGAGRGMCLCLCLCLCGSESTTGVASGSLTSPSY